MNNVANSGCRSIPGARVARRLHTLGMRAPRALAAGRLDTQNWQRYSLTGPYLARLFARFVAAMRTDRRAQATSVSASSSTPTGTL